jgi:single-strand DNA-binding protein
MTTSTHPSNEPRHRNEVLIAGNLVKPLEVRYTPSGKAVCNLTLVTAVTAKSKQYHRCVLWEDLVEQIAELKPGDFLELHGYLGTRSWETQTGEKRYMTQVVGRAVYVGGKKDTPEPLTPNLERNIHGVEIGDSDVPF